MKTRFVLDAWAMLVLLQGEEPAASRVKQLLQEGEQGCSQVFMSAINLGEVVYRVGKVKGDREAETTLAELRRLAVTFVAASDEAVLSAARLKMHHAISYADAFAAATAIDLDAVLVTGDPELLQLGEHVRIERLSVRREK
jgi:predicted nucleic acid-binding protein